MSERGPSEDDERAPSHDFTLARAIKIAAVLFALVTVAIALVAMLTDGAPHVPFDYGDGSQ
jgi:hypothetical protein